MNRTEKEVVAMAVAKFWLDSAESILNRGECPAKLTPQARMLVMEYADNQGLKISHTAIIDAARMSVQTARSLVLFTDKYPKVKAWIFNQLNRATT